MHPAAEKILKWRYEYFKNHGREPERHHVIHVTPYLFSQLVREREHGLPLVQTHFNEGGGISWRIFGFDLIEDEEFFSIEPKE